MLCIISLSTQEGQEEKTNPQEEDNSKLANEVRKMYSDFPKSIWE